MNSTKFDKRYKEKKIIKRIDNGQTEVLIPSRDIDDQKILQSDWIRDKPGQT